jgi:tetratricopeptide (TPR) repeat protein
VLAGLTGAVTLGVVFMTLKVASYAQVKAFYGLALLVPLCFFGAVGWEVFTRGRRLLQGALGALLLVWAMNSFASFWIVHSATQHVDAGMRWGGEHKLEAAMAEATQAVNSDPSNATARRFLAFALNDAGRVIEALPQAQQAVELRPMDGASHAQLAMVLGRQGQMEPAMSEARRALELEPENLVAYSALLGCLSKSGRGSEAIDVARDGLAVYPLNAELHQTLGVTLAQKEDFVMAAHHFVYALLLGPDLPQVRSNLRLALRFIGKAPNGLKRLQEVALFVPDAPAILNEVAWFFATQSDPTLRNGQEAIRLAEKACGLTGSPAPQMLATLAAAYAETDKIPQAVKIAEEARLQAQLSGNADAVNLTEKLLNAFQAGRAYHEEPAQK